MKAKMEKAQSLLLIAVAMLALLGLTAIAIDGGNVYRDRRQAPNAADNAALDAALAITQNQDWQQAASTRASQNGYSTTVSGVWSKFITPLWRGLMQETLNMCR